MSKCVLYPVYNTNYYICGYCQNKYLTNDPQECAILVKSLGVGSELEKIFKELHINSTNTCYCQEMINKMNQWGSEGCIEHKQEIFDHLMASYNFINATKVFLGGYWSLDSLLNEAIKRCYQ